MAFMKGSARTFFFSTMPLMSFPSVGRTTVSSAPLEFLAIHSAA